MPLFISCYNGRKCLFACNIKYRRSNCMKYKLISGLVAGLLIGIITFPIFAEENKASDDENMVVGACMIKKFKAHIPPVTEAKIESCSNVDGNAAPKCLGITDDEYMTTVKYCVSELINAKCVAGKMKVALIKYADCDYEDNTAECYKSLGFTPDAVTKLRSDCTSEIGK